MNPQTLQVVRLTSAADLAALADDWNALAAGVPFRTYDWLEAWWQVYGRQANQDLLVLAVIDATGQLVGLAPWYLESASSQRIIQFLGTGEVCTDYLTVLARSGQEENVAIALADWLTTDPQCTVGGPLAWDRIEMRSVYGDDKTLRGLIDQLSVRGYLVHRRARSSCWRVQLPATWEDYLDTLSKSHRKHLRRLDRKYFDSGRAQLHVVSQQQELEQGLAALVSLHQRRRSSLGESGLFASPRFAVFHRESASRLLAAGNLQLAWLQIDRRIAAAEYQFLGNGVVYAYQSGLEPDAIEHEPGRLISMALLRRAIEQGRSAFDFLRGDESYKAHWRAVPRPTLDIRVVANTARARWQHGLWVAGGSVKNWIHKRLATTGISWSAAL